MNNNIPNGFNGGFNNSPYGENSSAGNNTMSNEFDSRLVQGQSQNQNTNRKYV